MWDVSQGSMQLGWNTWLHLGNIRKTSSSSNSLKHTAHPRAALPNLCNLTSEYKNVGKVSITSLSSPRASALRPWLGLPPPSMVALGERLQRCDELWQQEQHDECGGGSGIKTDAGGGEADDMAAAAGFGGGYCHHNVRRFGYIARLTSNVGMFLGGMDASLITW
ncbi:hypothetical protein Ancab_038373 [Ancistrocladus abbreviatus]